MRFTGRVTACVSSQAGCAMGYVFCATGQMGFARHLAPGEIVTQVLHLDAQMQHAAECLVVGTVQRSAGVRPVGQRLDRHVERAPDRHRPVGSPVDLVGLQPHQELAGPGDHPGLTQPGDRAVDLQERHSDVEPEGPARGEGDHPGIGEQVTVALIEQDDVVLHLTGDVGQRVARQAGLVADQKILFEAQQFVAPVPAVTVAGGTYSPQDFVADAEEQGDPVVSNGLALCKLHHAAFDSFFLTVRPDYTIEIRQSILEENDGPMLLVGLKQMHDQPIQLPRSGVDRPDRDRLEQRYQRFLRAS